MGDPVFVGSLRDVEDVLRIHDEEILAVADRARLVGLVDRETLLAVDGSTVIGDIMDDPVGVTLDATLDEAKALAARFGTEAIPVVDDDGYLVGGLVAGDL